MTEPFWTPARASRLAELLAAGVTYAGIGRDLGITKNAAIGKAHRMGIEGPNSFGPKSTPPTLIERIAALNRFPPHSGCVFPAGNPGEEGFHFCCAPVAIVGAPYCYRHMARAYLPAGRAQLAMVKLGNVVQMRAGSGPR